MNEGARSSWRLNSGRSKRHLNNANERLRNSACVKRKSGGKVYGDSANRRLQKRLWRWRACGSKIVRSASRGAVKKKKGQNERRSKSGNEFWQKRNSGSSKSD